MSDSVCESMVAALTECGVNFLAVVSLFVRMFQYDKFSMISEEHAFIIVEHSQYEQLFTPYLSVFSIQCLLHHEGFWHDPCFCAYCWSMGWICEGPSFSCSTNIQEINTYGDSGQHFSGHCNIFMSSQNNIRSSALHISGGTVIRGESIIISTNFTDNH